MKVQTQHVLDDNKIKNINSNLNIHKMPEEQGSIVSGTTHLNQIYINTKFGCIKQRQQTNTQPGRQEEVAAPIQGVK